MSNDQERRSSSFGCLSVVILLAIIAAAVLGVWRCTFRVPQGCVAVLMSETHKTGDGLQEQAVGEGLHFYNPLITDYFIVDTTIHALALGAETDAGPARDAVMGATDYWRRRAATGYWELSRYGDVPEDSTRDANVEMRFPRSAVRVKTLDGEDAEVSITLIYRVSEEGASQFMRFIGAGPPNLENTFVLPAVRAAVRNFFGRLDSASFFDATLREARTAECSSALNEQLGIAGVTVESLAVDHFAFDAEFHSHIQEKRILERRMASVDMQRESEKEQLAQELLRAKATAKSRLADAERGLESARRDAESDIAGMGRQAEATLARARREAELARERAASLTGRGAELALKLELAKALRGKPVVILPDEAAANLGENFSQILSLGPNAVGPQEPR